MLASFARISYILFGSIVELLLPYLESTRLELKKGQVNILLEEYLSIGLMTGAVSAIFGLVITRFVFSLVFPAYSALMLLPLSLLSALTFFAIAFLGFLVYPSIAADSVKRGIELNLPFAVIYMATVSGSGIPPYMIFKLLAGFKEYGEISREARNITAETEFFGKDIGEAMRRAAERTPSKDFKELLWGMNTIIEEGGDLRKFLSDTAVIQMQAYKRRIEQYAQRLSLFLEIYLTVVVVGSIFFMIMGAIMSSMGGMEIDLLLLQRVMVYIALPLITIVFISIIKATSPVT